MKVLALATIIVSALGLAVYAPNGVTLYGRVVSRLYPTLAEQIRLLALRPTLRFRPYPSFTCKAARVFSYSSPTRLLRTSGRY
jgi:hypothetical protein